MPDSTALEKQKTMEEHPEVEVRAERAGCCSVNEFYVFNQAFAIVRHADRLDHTEEWETFPGRLQYPNDTPLTRAGFDHARKVGQVLKDSGKHWKMIVASPYYRCAQTASCISEVLKLPIHFDVDLGEVFDDVSMIGDCRGKPQYRPPDVLEHELRKDFPDVEYVRDEHGKIKIEGKLQRFPESFEGARMRYCYKVKKLVQQAAAEVTSVIIVTHGDAVASVVGMLKATWVIKHVPYTCYVIGDRQVKVMHKSKREMCTEEPVYVHPEQWRLQIDPGLVHVDCAKEDLPKAAAVHKKEMEEMDKKSRTIKTSYKLDPQVHEDVAAALEELAASPKDKNHLLHKANTSTFGEHERQLCRPGSGTKDLNQAASAPPK